MSTALIAVVVALLIGHHVPAAAQWRRFDWFTRWQNLWDAQLGAPAVDKIAGLLLVLSPALLLAALQWRLDEHLLGLPAFVLGVLVLVYCWGPRDLDHDVDTVLEADDPDARQQAAKALFPHGAADTRGAALVDAVFSEALSRWFGVLLWFLLLGPCGALLYRLAQRIEAPTRVVTVLRQALDWPAAQLMTLALALIGSFDTVLAAWRNWYRDHGDDWFGSGTGFLLAAARASVVTELADEAVQDTDNDDAEASTEDIMIDAVATSPLPALHDAMSLVWRMLIAWLTVLAVLVLAGYAG